MALVSGPGTFGMDPTNITFNSLLAQCIGRRLLATEVLSLKAKDKVRSLLLGDVNITAIITDSVSRSTITVTERGRLLGCNIDAVRFYRNGLFRKLATSNRGCSMVLFGPPN